MKALKYYLIIVVLLVSICYYSLNSLAALSFLYISLNVQVCWIPSSSVDTHAFSHPCIYYIQYTVIIVISCLRYILYIYYLRFWFNAFLLMTSWFSKVGIASKLFLCQESNLVLKMSEFSNISAPRCLSFNTYFLNPKKDVYFKVLPQSKYLFIDA